jgi:hypothetical protein
MFSSRTVYVLKLLHLAYLQPNRLKNSWPIPSNGYLQYLRLKAPQRRRIDVREPNRRWSRGEARVLTQSVVPFPLPAHQTGQAHFGHPAFRLDSSQTHERGFKGIRRSHRTPSSPYTAS